MRLLGGAARFGGHLFSRRLRLRLFQRNCVLRRKRLIRHSGPPLRCRVPPPAAISPERASPLFAPLLSLCCLPRWPSSRLLPTLPRERSSGGPDRSLPPGDTRQAVHPCPARIPAVRFCGRIRRFDLRPRAPAEKPSCAAAFAPGPARHPDKSPLPRLQRHPPAEQVCRGHRFSPHLAPVSGSHRGQAPWLQFPANGHSRCARGSSRVALRSIQGSSPAGTRSSGVRAQHLQGTPASRCPAPQSPRRQCPLLERLAVPEQPNCASARGPAKPGGGTDNRFAPQAVYLPRGSFSLLPTHRGTGGLLWRAQLRGGKLLGLIDVALAGCLQSPWNRREFRECRDRVIKV